MWGDRSPEGDPVTNAKILFEAENPPRTRYVSGSQDHIGLLVPGVSRLHYSGDYWPQRIETTVNPDICEWLSSAIWMVPIAPRPEGYDPLETRDLREEWVKTLGEAGNLCYKSILTQDVRGLGESMSQTFLMWRMILPRTVPDHIFKVWETYSDYPGAVTSGCGGGYLLVASDRPVENAIQIKVKYEISKEEIQD